MTDIFCIHPKVDNLDSFLDLTCLKEQSYENSLKWNPNNPSILIATEWIYYRKDLFRKFKDLYNTAEIKIAWLGEALDADKNIFDYSIGFSCTRNDDPSFIRILSPLDMYHRFIPRTENEINDPSSAEDVFHAKQSFCNFLYSNAHAHHMRDDLFFALNRYKRVDSMGKHMNNVERPATGYLGHAHECVSLKSPYKFSIAAENACFDGYTSEKIITSLIAHTIPVYWGNPSVSMDINPDCFINADDFDSLDSLVKRVAEIDSDDELWLNYICKPWFTSQQIDYHRQRTEDYFKKMSFLLSGQAPKMVPEGYHVDLYRKHFFNGAYAFDRGLITKITSRLPHFSTCR